MPALLALLSACECRSPIPLLLRETELRSWITVDRAEPIDPASVVFTIHSDGRLTWKGIPQTRAAISARLPRGAVPINRTPVLVEVEAGAGFGVVRDALQTVIEESDCVNIAFLTSTFSGPGAVVLPILAEQGHGYTVCEGRTATTVIGGSTSGRRLELLVTAGSGGGMEVHSVRLIVPGGVYFPEPGETPPNLEWEGMHPAGGRWTLGRLQQFLERPDVAALSPYVLFKVTTLEPAADVIGCLAQLRSMRGVPVVAEIPSR